ncbi:MAG: hypothetical protein QOE87_4077 [Gaiellales bacterium]|nr:hypothetical protein [Gaiellales bacterium]
MGIAIALALVFVIGLALRHGGTQPASWRPQGDWRERDPRS